MSGTYNDDLRSARMQLVADMVDGLTPAASTGTPAAGKLVIMDADDVELVEFELDVPAFAESGGILTLQGVPLSETGLADGVAAKAELRDSTDTVIRSNYTVGTSGTDILVADTAISLGEDAIVVGFTITHP